MSDTSVRRSVNAAVVLLAVVALSSCGGKGVSNAASRSRQDLVALLGVLRRAPSAADRDPGLTRRLAVLANRSNCRGLVADAPLIRFAGVTPWGQRIFVVPFKPPTCKPAPCTGTQRACAAPPPDEETVRLLSDTGGTPLYNPYPPLSSTPENVAEGPGVVLAAQEALPPIRELMLVPDGVRRVEFVFPRHPPFGPAHHATLRVFVLVHDNLAAVQVNRSDLGQSVAWYGPEGKPIKRFGDPALIPAR